MQENSVNLSHSPEKIPRNSRLSSFNVNYISATRTLIVILGRLPLRYLRDVAQEWFEPGISGLTNEPPEWFDNWEAFLDELHTNFGPYDETGDAEHELTNLCMRDSQCASDYLVHFSGLALRCSWEEPALRYRFYKGLPPRIKDELSKSEKPRTL
jgi:hypothetical protein